jgi:hypothetical protein
MHTSVFKLFYINDDIVHVLADNEALFREIKHKLQTQ